MDATENKEINSEPSGNRVASKIPEGFLFDLVQKIKSIEDQLNGKLWSNFYWKRENARMLSKKELFERVAALEKRVLELEELNNGH